jgi:outer membrane receptor protein involved in Fe transport
MLKCLARGDLAIVVTILACVMAPPASQAQIEEITVTARKTEESLQEVPISITAFSGDAMRERGIQNNYDVASFTPNFSAVQRVGRQLDRPTIRGMANPAVRGESNASYFIDGIFVASSISTATTQSMERVEVLRGPQSAQFGRATFSGAINYVTRKPTNDFEGNVNVRYGSHEDQEIGGWISGPIIRDKLLFLVSADTQHYGGQWKNNLETIEPSDPGVSERDANKRPINTGSFENVFQVDGGTLEDVNGDGWLDGARNIEGNPAGLPGSYVDQLGIGDSSAIGEENTLDILAKLTFIPFDSTEINIKYSYTYGDDGHFPGNIIPTVNGDPNFPNLNCYLPDDPTQAWYGTSIGDYCGEQKVDGTINQINIPDLVYGLQADCRKVVVLQPPCDQPFLDDGVTPNPNYLPVTLVTAPGQTPGLERTTHRVLLDWQQDWFDWSSLLRVGWSDDQFDPTYDFDKQDVRSVWGLFSFANQTAIDDKSFEFIVASPVEAAVRGSLGVYYYEQEESLIQRSITGPQPVFGLFPGTGYGDPRDSFIENRAVFGRIGFDLAPNWTMDIEARWGEDEKSIQSGQRSAFDNSSDPQSAKQDFSSFTPRVTLNWAAAEDLLVYGLIAKGNKPGGFNNEFFRSDVPSEFTAFALNCNVGEVLVLPQPTGPPLTFECSDQLRDDIIFDEEEQWTYEVGVKSQWFDRRLTANLSAFYIDWTNQGLFALYDVPSVSGGTTPVTILRNAGKSKIVGLELESSYVATENLLLFLNYGLAQGEFTEGSLPGVASTTGGDGSIVGNTVPDTPEHSVAAGFEASAQAGASLDAFLRTDYIYESKKYSGAGNFNWIGARSVVNVRTGLRADNWALTFYVRNLTDDDTPLNAAEFVNFRAAPISTGAGNANDGDPIRMYGLNPQRGRDYGVEFNISFGG